MKATVVHDENGRIIAISKAVDLEEAGSKFTRAGIIPVQASTHSIWN